jgi:hypothetical protein
MARLTAIQGGTENDGFRVRLDFAMQACCLGGFFGLLVRNRMLRRRKNAKQGALIA